jgi:hypothetical protein
MLRERSSSLGWVASIGLLALTACSRDRAHQRRELDEISDQHASEVRELDEARAEFARKNPMPKKLEFPGQGTLLLHECTLEGYPGHVELWLRYTYVNTTGHTIDAARITLTLSDPARGEQWTDETELALPMLFRLGPESSYTTYTHVPTRGMHLDPGWKWEIRAEAVVRGESSGSGSR